MVRWLINLLLGFIFFGVGMVGLERLHNEMRRLAFHRVQKGLMSLTEFNAKLTGENYARPDRKK